MGLAVGDALGAPLEGLKAGHIAQLLGEAQHYADSTALFPDRPGKWRLPGLYTDDTQQALAIAEVLAVYGEMDVEALREIYLRLANEGPPRAALGAHRGTGSGFRRALETMRQEDDPRRCGQPSAGNGAAMRIAPVGLYYAERPEEAVRQALRASLLTHADPRGLGAAAAMAAGVARCLTTDSPDKPEAMLAIARELLGLARRAEDLLVEEFAEALDGDILAAHLHTFSDCLGILESLVREGNDELAEKTILKQANEAGAQGRIAHTHHGFAPASVVMALYRALSAADFLNGLLGAVNAGGDADTVGAMTGALLGARFGIDAIPEAWRRGLANADQVALRGRAMHEKQVDWAAWADLVATEREWTEREMQWLARAASTHGKEIDRRRQEKARRAARKEQRQGHEDLGFAPPPEVWLRNRDKAGEDDFDDLPRDPIEAARERALRGRKRVAWKEERRRKQRHRNQPEED